MTRLGYKNPRTAPAEHPTVKDICWAAGVFEGEGYCGRSKEGWIYCSIGQKDPWILYRMQALFGGAISLKGFPTWSINGVRARGFLLTIYMFQSPRRQEQIRKAFGKK